MRAGTPHLGDKNSAYGLRNLLEGLVGRSGDDGWMAGGERVSRWEFPGTTTTILSRVFNLFDAVAAVCLAADRTIIELQVSSALRPSCPASLRHRCSRLLVALRRQACMEPALSIPYARYAPAGREDEGTAGPHLRKRLSRFDDRGLLSSPHFSTEQEEAGNADVPLSKRQPGLDERGLLSNPHFSAEKEGVGNLGIPFPKRQSPFDDLAVLLSNPRIKSPRVDDRPDSTPEAREPSLSHSLLLIPRQSPQSKTTSASSSLSALQIPECALGCYITTLTTDGCASETDFKCHCSTGNILGKAASCVAKNCSSSDEKDAKDKIVKACESVGIDLGGGNGDGDEDSSSSQGSNPSSTRAGGSSTGTSAPASASSSAASSPSSTPSENPSSDTPNPQPTAAPAPAPAPTGSNPSASTSSSPSSTSPPPMPTDTPLALLPTDRQLSPGAKAGISLSVSILTLSVLLTIGLYIRRLKRDLRAAQAAAGVPESVWRASIQTAAAPSGVGRRKSWGGRGRSRSRRRSSSGGDDGPVSPLSPRSMAEMEQSGGFGVLKKKKRGHVLSVVVEREEEDSSSTDRIIHEPVPGQKEGLVDPLELDGEYTGIVELPTSITPRARSVERGRARGASLGESSRPSTGDLEKIEEKQWA
ncbi:hypothetical protein BU26DRAFT_510496 [Trematosphaeria pertusa]|uniref:CFEM domain-containing protein n=1 Tax=Trematosphaeria pertusa TaxID=390896 RepID=A0A6A6HZA3_9PLEO|nr:uncharacterized protein BU26DRAFT_510496 [Trematosphaeria pertusa]KAF2242670.1 hypothetical protein BU26DRAFT_510496 [Trematosphaeria pertusa]